MDSFVKVTVKRLRRPIFIPLKIELDWEVYRFFCGERPHRRSEEGGFASLPRCGEDDVASEFDAVNKIGEFRLALNDVVSLRQYGSARFKGFGLSVFHSMLLRVVEVAIFILSHRAV